MHNEHSMRHQEFERHLGFQVFDHSRLGTALGGLGSHQGGDRRIVVLRLDLQPLGYSCTLLGIGKERVKWFPTDHSAHKITASAEKLSHGYT